MKSMKLRKRLYAWILTVAIVLTLVPVTASDVVLAAVGERQYEPIDIDKNSLNGNAIWGASESYYGVKLDNWAHFYCKSRYENGGLPNDGKLTMPVSGVKYQLASGDNTSEAYDGNDCIWLTYSNRSATMNLKTIGAYEEVYVLATAGGPGKNGYADFSVTLTYTDNSTSKTNYYLYDWYGLNDVKGVEKYYDIMRMNNNSTTVSGKTDKSDGPVFHSATINVEKDKLLKSITFTINGMGGDTTNTISDLFCGIFAVTGVTPAGVPERPVATQATKVVGDTSGDFTANWNPVSDASGYRLDVSTRRDFTTMVINNVYVGNVTSYKVSGSEINNNTIYYYRVRAVNDKGQSLSSNRVATDLPIWIKNAISESDSSKILYDAETNTIKINEDISLRDTINLPENETVTINTGNSVVTAPDGKAAVVGSGANINLIIEGNGGSSGFVGTNVASGDASPIIDFRNATGASSIGIEKSNITGSNGGKATEDGIAGAGGAGIAASDSTNVKVGNNATITGGDGGSSESVSGSSINGGDGGNGISGGCVTVSSTGKVTGGNGGNSVIGAGGNGGSGISGNNVSGNGNNVSGGNGGNGVLAGSGGTSGGSSGSDGSSHVHNMIYIVDEDVIKAYCTQEKYSIGCDYYGIENAGKITFEVEEEVPYSGKEYDGAVITSNLPVDDNNPEITKDYISYYKVSEYGLTSGGTEVSGVPVEVGYYYAVLTYGGYQLKRTFKITKTDVVSYTAPVNKNDVYNGQSQNLVTEGICDGGTFYYSMDKTNWQTDVPEAVNNDEYTIYYYIKGDANHNDNGSENEPLGEVKSTIEKRPLTDTMVMISFDSVQYTGGELKPTITISDKLGSMEIITEDDYTITGTLSATEAGEYTICVTAKENYTGVVKKTWRINGSDFKESDINAPDVTETYSGNPYSGRVTVTKQDVRDVVIRFKDKEGNYTLNESPMVTDATETPVEISYQVTAKGYNPYYGTLHITVNKAVLTVIPDSSQSKEYGENDPELTYTVEGLAECDKDKTGIVTGTLTRREGEACGEYDIYGNGLSSHNYIINFTNGIKFTVEPKDIAKTSVLFDSTDNTYVYNEGTIIPQITVKNGNITLIEGVDYILSGDVNASSFGTYKLVVSGTGNYKGSNEVIWNVKDSKPPVGTITIRDCENGTWDRLLNNISFGLFFKEKQKVTINAEDEEDGSGVGNIYYYIDRSGNGVLTASQLSAVNNWTLIDNNKEFIVDKDSKLVIYAMISDKSGNITYICSQGIVIDTKAPVISGVTDGKSYCEKTEFTVADDNLKSVMLDGNTINAVEGRYSVAADNKEHTIEAVDEAGNTQKVTIAVYDGHEWNEPIYNWSDDRKSCTAVRTCKHDDSHKESQECKVESSIIKPAEGTKKGEIVYTVTVTFDDEQYTQKKQEETEKTAEITVGNGTIATEIKIADDVMNSKIDNFTTDMAKKLISEDELKLVNSGEDAVIYLEVKNADNTVSDADKKQIEDKFSQIIKDIISNDKEISSERELTTKMKIIDLTLYKKVGNAQAFRIVDMGSEKIKVTFTVPCDMRSSNEKAVYNVVRVHYNENSNLAQTEIIPSVYNKDDYTLTFETGRFSSYAVIYAEPNGIIVPADDDNDDTESNIQEETVVKTGDSTPVGLLIVFMFTSLMGMGVITLRERKYIR